MLHFLKNACIVAAGAILLLHAFGYLQAFEAPMMMILGLLVLGAGIIGLIPEKHRK